MAEHHSMPGIASAATAVALAFVGAGTSTIRIGAGGIMLPNHAPLVIAEQFGTLESLFPGRVDLGLGRAPGTDRPPPRRFAATSPRTRTASRRTSSS
jgi:luciferase family oxidoreductase group 1